MNPELTGLWRHEFADAYSYARLALREGRSVWETLMPFEEVRDAVVYALWPRIINSRRPS